MKKTLALILTFIMVLALVPSVAFAAGEVAWINGKGYATLGEAVKDAQSGDTITLGEGEYTLYNIPSDNTTKGKNLTFIGQGFDKTTWNIGTGTVDVFGQGNGDFSFNGSGTIEFQNMTLKAAVINGTGEQVDWNYTGFAHTTNTIVKNCTVNGKTFYWGYTSATFTNTTFNCPAGDYAVWTYSSPMMTFDECTFNSSGKVINVYTDYGAGKYDITVNFKNCTVNNEEGTSLKPVLNINDSNMDKFKYILNITGDNNVTGVDVDNITHSSLFGFGGKENNNAGKTVVQIEGTTVWQDGKMESPATGTLTVKKTVSGGGADYNKAFTFTVTLKMPEITVDALATPITNATPDTSAAPTPVTETYGDVTFTNGVATFTLKHGESKTIKDIPAGYTYTVTESDNAGYTVTMSGNTGTIKAGETSTAAFNNYKAGGDSHSHYYPTTTPVPVIVIPPKTGDMTVWQSILHFLGIR